MSLEDELSQAQAELSEAKDAYRANRKNLKAKDRFNQAKARLDLARSTWRQQKVDSGERSVGVQIGGDV